MTLELKKELKKWKSTAYTFSKLYNVKKSPLQANEYWIILTISTTINILSHDENISVSKSFFTFAQSSNDPKINKAGDIYRIKIVIDNLEKEFEEKLNYTIEKFLQVS